jgi:peptidoglycan hydrolase-like amidase
MRKLWLVLVVFLGLVLITPTFFVRADELDDINKEIEAVKNLLEESRKASEPLEQNLNSIQQKVNFIEGKLVAIGLEVEKKAAEIKTGEKELIEQKKVIDQRAKKHYIQSRSYLNNLLALFLTKNIQDASRSFFYHRQGLQKDRDVILKIAFFITDLEKKKQSLEEEKLGLASARAELDKQKDFFQEEVAKAKNYQSELETKIAQLSAKQQQLVNQRLASLNIPRSAGTSARGCSDDRGVNPGFSPSFALFTYGAPHRNGLNQYGAWGRAKSGQNEDQILQEYYPGMELNKSYDQNIQITTTTGWAGSIEEYVKRIYEVPDSWTDNNSAVLKAQAVAARTYALRVTANGSKPICTSEQCQVFKPEPKGGNWEQAVSDMAGWVLLDGGSPGFTQYASTHGGYILNITKFDGHTGNPGSFAELNDRAYDKESPWFYCDWGARSEYLNTAWLRPEELADIVNVILLARKDSSLGDHLYQTDKPHPYGGEIWSADKVRSELRARGTTPYGSISSANVSPDLNSGKTSSVTVSGDAGSDSFSGSEFKDWFNLRAPANIQIVGPLFNVERQ